MSQSQKLRHDSLGLLVEQPRLFTLPHTVRPLDDCSVLLAIGRCRSPLSRMQTEDGRKDAILHPTSDELVASPAAHVAADIMTPPAVANIGGRCGKLWLKLQRCPADNGVTREADRIPLTAWSGKPGENDSLSAITSAIQILEMVQHPGRERERSSAKPPSAGNSRHEARTITDLYRGCASVRLAANQS